MNLKDAWEAQAEKWARWTRAPGHDSYWVFHRDQFLELVPPPGRLTLDVGCGEGRLARDLKCLGHRVIAIDASPTLVGLAREADPEGDYRVADAAVLPLDDASVDLAIAFMSLQDIDEMEEAVREVARVLVLGGRFCFAVVHPINSAGTFVDRADPQSPFVIDHSYFERRRYVDEIERAGLEMTFVSDHRPLTGYLRPLEDAGLLVDAVREPIVPSEAYASERARRWERIPLFLHVRAVKP